MNPHAARAPHPTHAAHVARAAVLALHDELALTPKPGLVSFENTGSHGDMDAQTFMRSLRALRHYFHHIAAAGASGAGFATLEALGIAAERRMLAATGGINTHRGAIFLLGLMCAGLGATIASSTASPTATRLRDTVARRWGDALAARCGRPSLSHGRLAARRHGLRSANDEAAAGFPTLFDVAWPAHRHARAQGLDDRATRLHVFFHTLAALDDTNLVHRGGLAGLRDAQRAAQGFVDAGGAMHPDAVPHARAIHEAFVARRLSPGGSADVLAAVCLLERAGVR